MPKLNTSQHRNISVDSTNIPEPQQQEVPTSPTGSGSQPNDTSCSSSTTTTAAAVDLGVADTVTSKPAVPGTSKSLNSKNMSKAAVLRNLFFSQHQDGSSGSGSAGNSKA